MTDKCLEVVRQSLLCLVIPDFEHGVLTSSEEVPWIAWHTLSRDTTSMHWGDLSQKDSFIPGEGIKSDTAVIGHDYKFTIAISKEELLDLLMCVDLVMHYERLRVVYVNIVPVVSHDSEEALGLISQLNICIDALWEVRYEV